MKAIMLAALLTLSMSVSAGWITVSGTVQDESGNPICGMALANGQHMFTCGANLGTFSLYVPTDAANAYTLQVYAQGFMPNVQSHDQLDIYTDVELVRAQAKEYAPTTYGQADWLWYGVIPQTLWHTEESTTDVWVVDLSEEYFLAGFVYFKVGTQAVNVTIETCVDYIPGHYDIGSNWIPASGTWVTQVANTAGPLTSLDFLIQPSKARWVRFSSVMGLEGLNGSQMNLRYAVEG